MRAARYVGIGGLHLAHVTKDQPGKDVAQKPFGSAFWANLARATWHIRADADEVSGDMEVLLSNRKSNLGRLIPPLAYRVTFGEAVSVRRIDAADSPGLSGHLSVRQRMVSAVRRRPLPLAVLAEEIDAAPETVSRTARRYSQIFTLLDDGRIALLEHEK